MKAKIQPNQNQALNELFKTIEPEQFVLYMKMFMHASIMLQLENEGEDIYKQEIKQGYYWLNEFVECFQPSYNLN